MGLGIYNTDTQDTTYHLAPWYVRNDSLHTDINMTDVIERDVGDGT
jgi:hypothetical protein